MPSVLSIQSAVAYGHVGNSAAVFPLQRLGIDVWPVPTVILSNHPGHGACRGHKLKTNDVEELLKGIEERGMFNAINAVVTGYLGDPALGPLVIQTVAKMKAIDPQNIYACDPVMGDHGGFFVADGLPEFFREQAMPMADILTPNLFELGYLSALPTSTLKEIEIAAKSLVAKGPDLVLVTSVETPEHQNEIGMMAVTNNSAHVVFTPKLDLRLNGTGDCLTALTLAHYIKGCSPKELLAITASTMFGLVEATHAQGSKELCLIQAQDQIMAPTKNFVAIEL